MPSPAIEGRGDAAVKRLIPFVGPRLAKASPWVFAIATLLTGVGLVCLYDGLQVYRALADEPPLAQTAALSCTFLACVAVIPAILLYRYAAAVKNAARTRSLDFVIEAIRLQSLLWTFSLTTLLLAILIAAALSAVHAMAPNLALQDFAP